MDTHGITTSTADQRGCVTRLLISALDLYGLMALLYLLLRFSTGDWLWPVALANAFTPWLLGFSLFSLPVALLLRQPRTIAAQLPALLALLLIYGPFFSGQPPVARAADSQPLRVMAFNLGADIGPAQPVVDLIRAENPDIVGLLELGDEAAPALDAELADLYPYRVLDGRDVPGTGLLSRYPILESEGPFTANTAFPMLFATLDVGGEPVRVIVAHPPRPGLSSGFYRYQDGYLPDLELMISEATAGGPALLLGDFNMTDQTQYYRLIRSAGLQDSFREAGRGFGFTYPERWFFGGQDLFLMLRIDYIFHTAHFEAVNAWVGPDAGSDHRPLTADLRLHRQ